MTKAGTAKLDEAIENLVKARKIYKKQYETLVDLGDPRRGSDYDGNTRAGISDPTPTHAFHLRPWHDLRDEVDLDVVEVCARSRLLVQHLNRVPSDVDTKELAAKHRCHVMGAEALESWARPECTNVIGEGSTTMLCDACRQRKAEHRRKQAAA